MAGLGAKEILRNVSALEQLIEEINFQRAKEMRQCLMSKESDTGFVMVQGTTYWTDLFVRHFLFQTDRLADADDLLFFIRKKHIKGSRYIPKYQTEVEVYRKDSRKLPIGDPDIDWEETVYLNLIIHQFDYTLTLAVCTRTSPKELQVLRRHSQKVYASPSRRRMDTKGDVEEITYPNVCFHVDNFDEVFDDMLVRDGEMVCVELVAADQSGARQAVIFLGSIRYDALKRVYDARASLSSKVAQRMMLGLFSGSSNQRMEFVRMKGPQGKGHAEMAVTKTKGLGGAETPTSEPGVALTDMWDSDWEDEPEDRFIYRHQRRLSDPSANFNTFMNSGWKSRSEGARSRSENEGLDHFADGLYEIESGDVRDALCSGRCCGSVVGCNQENQETKLDQQPEVTCQKCRHFHFMAQDMAPLSDTEEETEPEGQPLLGTVEQRDKHIDFHIDREMPSDQQNISREQKKIKALEGKNQKVEDEELQPFLRVDTDSDACTNIKIENEKQLEIGADQKYVDAQDLREISKENKFVSYLDTKSVSELTLEPELEYCKVLEIGSDPIAENIYKLETDTIENNSNKTISVEDNCGIQQINDASMASNIIRQNNELIDLSGSKVESSNRRPKSCHVLDHQTSNIDVDSTKNFVCKRSRSFDASNELPNVPICDIKIKDDSALQDDENENLHKEFIIIDSKTIDGGRSETIKETSFISKEIQEQICKANSSTSLPISLNYEDKAKTIDKSLSEEPIVSFSSKRIRQKQGRKPGTAFRLTSKDNQKTNENDKGNDPLFKIESDPIDPSIPSTSKEHNQTFKDYVRSKDYSQLVKASSCDSAESATALNNEDDVDSMHSIEALSLSPTKKRKRRKISVPFIKTSDGTVIKFFCDAKLDDGAYNQLWTTKGFTQTFHFWKEHRRQTSVPLNAYLTYVTLPWFTIITDILDHRSGPILTF